MGTLYENIYFLCERKKIKPSKMCVDLGLSKSLITKLKSKPEKTITADTAKKIADYFGVTVDRVLGTEQKEKPDRKADELDAETIELREIWDNSDADERQALLQMARLLKKRRNE